MANIKYKYIGTDERTLAQVGPLQPGDTFEVTPRIALALDANSPELYERQPDATAESITDNFDGVVAPVDPAAIAAAPVDVTAPAAVVTDPAPVVTAPDAVATETVPIATVPDAVPVSTPAPAPTV